jgi:hypothetical protein
MASIIKADMIMTESVVRADGATQVGRLVFEPRDTALISGITWSSAQNNTDQTIGSITGANTSNVVAILVALGYTHNGGLNHGYLSGTLYQTGKDPGVDGYRTNNAHYDWYFNVMEVLMLLPWDPNGTQSLIFRPSDAFNSSGSNTYRFDHRGIYRQT